MGGTLVPVVDNEKSRHERGNERDAASRAHRAFQDPHSLHRGNAPGNDAERDSGQHVVRKRPSGLVKNAKGQWVKPGKDNPAAAAAAGEARGEPQRFIPERQWQGQRLGYYFALGKKGLGYYVDVVKTADGVGEETWKRTWAELQTATAREKEAKREEARRGREDRRDASAQDPHDYRGGRGVGGDGDGGGGGGGRGGWQRQRRHRRGGLDDDERRRDDSRDCGRGRSRSRSQSRSRSRDTERDRGGGGGGSGAHIMTQKEKEAAALARLAAKRSGGGGARVGGVPTAGFRGGGGSYGQTPRGGGGGGGGRH